MRSNPSLLQYVHPIGNKNVHGSAGMKRVGKQTKDAAEILQAIITRGLHTFLLQSVKLTKAHCTHQGSLRPSPPDPCRPPIALYYRDLLQSLRPMLQTLCPLFSTPCQGLCPPPVLPMLCVHPASPRTRVSHSPSATGYVCPPHPFFFFSFSANIFKLNWEDRQS